MGNLPLQREWIWDWFASPVPLWIGYISTALAFILHPILFGLHIHRKVIKPRKQEKISNGTIRSRSEPSSRGSRTASSSKRSVVSSSKHNMFSYKTDKEKVSLIRNITTITTLMSLIFGWIASIVTFLNSSSSISSPSTCLPITILQNICWIITKLTIYQVLILRLTASFWGSVHEYNRCLMLTAYIFVTVISIICIIGSIIDDESVGVDSIYFNEGWCLLIIPSWLILLPCVLDVICSVFISYLFIRVLNKLLSMNHGNIANNEKLLGVTILMTKLLFLTLISVLSNLFGGIWFAVTDIALFTYLDTIINPIALVLMEAQHNDIYYFCCKYCHIAMHRIVHHKRPDVAEKPFIIKENKENEKNKENTGTQMEKQMNTVTPVTPTTP